MPDTVKKIIISAALALVLLCIFSAAVSAETVPKLTRDYIQQDYENVSVNHHYTLIMTVIVFAITAVVIPAVFFAIDKIRSLISALSANNKKAKKRKKE